MPETVRLEEQYSIVTETDRVTVPSRVLKHGDTFGVFDAHGDIIPAEAGEHGLYHAGTRFLSRLELLFAGRRPLLLSSTISEDNTMLAVDLTNPDIVVDGSVVVPRGSVHLFRSRVLWNGSFVERIRISNHALHAIEVPIALQFDADFADVFEVRGTHRPRRGTRLENVPGAAATTMGYVGLDGVERRARLRWDCAPERTDRAAAVFALRLDSHAVRQIEIALECEIGAERREQPQYDATLTALRTSVAAGQRRACAMLTSHASFNRWIRRSAADLGMMISETASGPYPYAGIPWFSTAFGRDGIITALEMLWAAPHVARGVLAFLADTQATEVSDPQDAQPGKILHETREGEMAALGEIPFGRYYGSADSTPLFVMLAHAYFERTGDAAFVDRLWPHVLAALDWMDGYGDPDHDGFIEYARRTESGLAQQGWKDSFDSVFHDDGALAEPPIALCEVQGYAYAAWNGAAQMAAARGDGVAASRWRARADRLKARFDDAFWCEDLGTYALALDGAKRPCRVRTSNPGHCLFTGIVGAERAARVAECLMSEALFAGWGVRTLAAGEARYNPMSYHNGSIWPHDNAIVAAGLARYGFTSAATRITAAMFDLSEAVEGHRLPELLCGFHRREGEFPTLYPVACAPQAWASGAVYLLLQSSLGLEIDAAARRILLRRSVLPESIESMRLSNLTVGDATIDLLLTRHVNDVGVAVLRREGDVEIVAVK